MASKSIPPFLVKSFWGGEISYINGVVMCDESTLSSSFIIRYRMPYRELLDTVYNLVQVDKEHFTLHLIFCFTFQGISETSHVVGDDSLAIMYYLAESQANFRANFHVKMQPIIPIQQTTCVDLLRGFSRWNNTDVGASTYTNLEDLSFQQHNDICYEDDDDGNSGFDNSKDCNSEDTEDAHNCYGTIIGNNNRCLKSKEIAAHIIPFIREDISFPVKQIRAHIKDKLKVNVSYDKAWHGRRKAIEAVYGSWESNFNELAGYIEVLKATNHTTVVEWLHHPHGSSQHATFKYVFWAFVPSIRAISVYGTHLKGSYRGNMLIVVTKNANHHILPLAYAIVDEEMVESWCWFFQQFRVHIAKENPRQLCVLSDRHNGIIYAMKNLPEWKEPYAFHRFCLRHIRSNFMRRFRSSNLKMLCWSIGSTTQGRKYWISIREMKNINPDA